MRLHRKIALSLWITAISACGISSGPSLKRLTSSLSFVPLVNNQAARLVIGQPNFTTVTTNTADRNLLSYMDAPSAAISPSGALYVSDGSKHRVLGFNPFPTTNGANADFVIGQTTFQASTSGTNGGLSWPASLSTTPSGALIVADATNRRILIYNSAPTGSGAIVSAPDVAIGGTLTTAGSTTCTASTLNTPESVYVASGKLLVADTLHNRVLIFNSIPTTTGQSADLVLGQSNFTTCTAGTTASQMKLVFNMWSDGNRIAVADANNNRVLIWNQWPSVNGQAADIVLGQPDTTSSSMNAGGVRAANTLNYPQAVSSNGTQFFVADSQNNRVLIWDSFPTQNQQPADKVLGQVSMVTGNAPNPPTDTSLNYPTGILLTATSLIVTDGGNGRILVFGSQ